VCEILAKLGHQSELEIQFRHGDPLYVAEDGHGWGRYESKQQWIAEGLGAHNWPGGFLIIKIPKVPAAALNDLVRPHGNGVWERRHTIDLSGVETGNGFVVVELDQFMTSVRSKPSGASA
jgi:hypothetical protein